MRLSPFPKDADQPLRGVWVYAAHGIEQQMRIWTFWLTVLGLPGVWLGIGLISLVSGFGGGTAPMPLALVASDATVEQRVLEAADLVGVPLVAQDPTQSSQGPVLFLEGPLDALQPRLVLPDGADAQSVRYQSELILHRARSEAFLTVAQAARLSPSGPEPEVLEVAPEPTTEPQTEPPVQAAPEAQGITSLLSMLEPLIVGMFAMFGLIGGASSAMELSRARDDEYFNVLRLGTPTSVIFLGSLLERSLLGLFRLFPLLMLFIPLFALILVVASLMQSDVAIRLLVGVPILALMALGTTFFLAAGAGAVSGATSRGQARAGGSQRIFPILLLMMAPLLLRVLDHQVIGMSPLLLLPAVSLPMAARGMSGGLSIQWLVVVVAIQWLWAIGGLRLGVWAYGLEEPLTDDIKRRWSRWQTA